VADRPLGRAARQLKAWLDDANDNTRTLSRAWQLVRAWKDGSLPQTTDELVNWGLILQRGKLRAKRQVKALDGLLDIIAAKMADPDGGGMSVREVARVLAVPTSTANRHIVQGRETLAKVAAEALEIQQNQEPTDG
jgi:DNA-directed RNA polymerase specialized sigma24 family protein